MADRKFARLLRRFEDAVIALSWVGSRTGDDGPEADPEACRDERDAARAAVVAYVEALRTAGAGRAGE